MLKWQVELVKRFYPGMEFNGLCFFVGYKAGSGALGWLYDSDDGTTYSRLRLEIEW